MTSTFDYFTSKPDLKVINYKIANGEFHHFGVFDSETRVQGTGGAKTPLLAQTKATFEMIERTVFNFFSKGSTSSGWASHDLLSSAKANAEYELIERDAILTSWLLKISPKKIGPYSFQSFRRSFEILQFAKINELFVLAAILETENNQRMLISTTSDSIEQGVENLMVDAERAKMIIESSDSIVNPLLCSHHLAFCKSSRDEISWLFNDGVGVDYGSIRFKHDIYEVPLWNGNIAWVVKAESDELQSLFYGETEEVKINKSRIEYLKGSINTINTKLHPLL